MGLVKILCIPKAQREGPIDATLHNKEFAHWLGAICHAQSLYVWVPAHEVSPDLLVRVLVELVANYWSWPGGGGYNPTTPELVSN